MNSKDAINAEEAYEQSLNMLRRCLTPAGFVDSLLNIENYGRIWSRNGIITGLAALASGDKELVQGFERTLNTLASYQGPHGEIPSNVVADNGEVSYGHLAGRVDALLWYVIGVCTYLNDTSRTSYSTHYRLSIEKAMNLAECWEFNARGFIYTPITGNWADEYIQQGYVLSDQLLYLTALQSAGRVFDHQGWRQKAETLRRMIEVNYWPRRELLRDALVYHPHAYRFQVEQGVPPYWLPAFSPAGYTTYFDSLAHALVLLTDIGSDDQRRLTLGYTQSLAQQIGNALLPAFWPVIRPGDHEWLLLETNHLYGRLKNQPHMYHNGGLWPMLTGLYALGLVRYGYIERAQQLLTAVNVANEQGNEGRHWDFAEYHHGQTFAPMGIRYQAWSAAAAILAYQAVRRSIVVWPL
jgi:hypothetical protein